MMFGWVILVLLYLFLLFNIVSWGDKNFFIVRWIIFYLVIYLLVLVIYCIVWMFFGVVG